MSVARTCVDLHARRTNLAFGAHVKGDRSTDAMHCDVSGSAIHGAGRRLGISVFPKLARKVAVPTGGRARPRAHANAPTGVGASAWGREQGAGAAPVAGRCGGSTAGGSGRGGGHGLTGPPSAHRRARGGQEGASCLRAWRSPHRCPREGAQWVAAGTVPRAKPAAEGGPGGGECGGRRGRRFRGLVSCWGEALRRGRQPGPELFDWWRCNHITCCSMS